MSKWIVGVSTYILRLELALKQAEGDVVCGSGVYVCVGGCICGRMWRPQGNLWVSAFLFCLTWDRSLLLLVAEYARLAAPLPLVSPKRWQAYSLCQAFI